MPARQRNSGHRISAFRIPTAARRDHADRMFLTDPPSSESVQALYDEDRASDGYVNNLTRVWGWRPDLATAFTETRALLIRESDLSAADVALLVAATAAARADSYCALAWGTRLAAQTDVETASNVVGGSFAGLDGRTAELADWARHVALDPNSTTSTDIARLHGIGLNDRQIFEATLLIALRMAFSTVNDALAAHPDAQLAQAAPPEVRAAVSYGRPPSDTPSV
jgi:alkylhydroperoxidase family enzyme